jgi:hypothetical protein
MSQCHLCGTPDTGTVLIKCQWFGRGTKWLCVECLRTGSVQPTGSRPAVKPRGARAGTARAGRVDAGTGSGRNLL